MSIQNNGANDFRIDFSIVVPPKVIDSYFDGLSNVEEAKKTKWVEPLVQGLSTALFYQTPGCYYQRTQPETCPFNYGKPKMYIPTEISRTVCPFDVPLDSILDPKTKTQEKKYEDIPSLLELFMKHGCDLQSTVDHLTPEQEENIKENVVTPFLNTIGIPSSYVYSGSSHSFVDMCWSLFKKNKEETESNPILDVFLSIAKQNMEKKEPTKEMECCKPKETECSKPKENTTGSISEKDMKNLLDLIFNAKKDTESSKDATAFIKKGLDVITSLCTPNPPTPKSPTPKNPSSSVGLTKDLQNEYVILKKEEIKIAEDMLAFINSLIKEGENSISILEKRLSLLDKNSQESKDLDSFIKEMKDKAQEEKEKNKPLEDIIQRSKYVDDKIEAFLDFLCADITKPKEDIIPLYDEEAVKGVLDGLKTKNETKEKSPCLDEQEKGDLYEFANTVKDMFSEVIKNPEWKREMEQKSTNDLIEQFIGNINPSAFEHKKNTVKPDDIKKATESYMEKVGDMLDAICTEKGEKESIMKDINKHMGDLFESIEQNVDFDQNSYGFINAYMKEILKNLKELDFPQKGVASSLDEDMLKDMLGMDKDGDEITMEKFISEISRLASDPKGIDKETLDRFVPMVQNTLKACIVDSVKKTDVDHSVLEKIEKEEHEIYKKEDEKVTDFVSKAFYE